MLRGHVHVSRRFSRSTSMISSRWRQVTRLLMSLALLVERLGCLRDDVLVLHVGRHVDDFVGDDAGLLVDACGTASSMKPYSLTRA